MTEHQTTEERAIELLRQLEWQGHNGYCPCCDGWEAEPGRGCTPGKHSKGCELAKLIGAEVKHG